jgi:hypothetical protein
MVVMQAINDEPSSDEGTYAFVAVDESGDKNKASYVTDGIRWEKVCIKNYRDVWAMEYR